MAADQKFRLRRGYRHPAFRFGRTDFSALSLELVKPATCASVAVGAVLSGLVLANGIAQKRLLCGVSVGVFYALCLSLTTALSGKPLVFDHVNLALLAALLFGGTAGGVLSALGAVGNTAPER